MNIMGRLLRSLSALIVLVAVVIGAPIALWVLGRDLLPARVPSLGEVWEGLTSRDTGGVFLGLLVVIGFIARHGQMRGIYDYTDVEAIAVPQTRLVQRAQQPAIMRDQRVIVASRVLGGEGARAYGRYQREAGEKEAAVVDTLEAAYRLLELDNPRFEPVEQ